MPKQELLDEALDIITGGGPDVNNRPTSVFCTHCNVIRNAGEWGYKMVNTEYGKMNVPYCNTCNQKCQPVTNSVGM